MVTATNRAINHNGDGEIDLVTNFVQLKDGSTATTNVLPTSQVGVNKEPEDRSGDPDIYASTGVETRDELCNMVEGKSTVQLSPSENDNHGSSTNEEISIARALAEEGPALFQIAAFFGGFATIFTSVIDFLHDSKFIGGLPSLDFVLTSFYIWAFGVFIVILEGKRFLINVPSIHSFASLYLKSLTFAWGRGIFYFFSGSLSYCLMADYGTMCGIYMMSVGAATFTAGVVYFVDLGGILRSVPDDFDVQSIFEQIDSDADGYLNNEDFREFVLNMGLIEHDQMDLDGQFKYIDRDCDNLISLEELDCWVESIRNQTYREMFEEAAHYLV
mmetsp:Transcript_22577/g.33447  ORF Transcript_22577/g.33447 Transcript_22577/m.33447 type:complete len:330 (-) Transcript_22577:59-1048(-)